MSQLTLSTCCSPPKNDSEYDDYIDLLLTLITNEDWVSFNSIGLCHPLAFKFIAKSISDNQGFNGMTILHACIRFNAPQLIVSKIIELCPEMASAQDCLKRTPLHVACGTDAHSDVILTLTEAYPEACESQDIDGRTPLHFACDESCELFEDDAGKSSHPVSLDVVRILLSKSFEALALEDENGMSPLEYAICSEAEVTVIMILMKATQKQMRLKTTADLPVSEGPEFVWAFGSRKNVR